ncbi:MAG: polyprenyl synthetase family protein [Planctomycetota bacterium]|nr:polyprenyl synthetase family protein [Planctomycetota bacterium]
MPLTKDEMEKVARTLLEQEGLPEGYVGWIMVVLATEFYRDQVAGIPPERRLFLLPHCLKHAEGCPADYDEFGMNCKTCGACSIADFRAIAEEMGYKILVAEGSPIVLKIIVSGYVDAICGVACLNVLEKAIDKILLAGIPCMAVPLLSSDCRNTKVDEEWVSDMIRTKSEQPAPHTRTYLPLLREASRLFEAGELDRIAPRQRKSPQLADLNGQGIAGVDPVAGTECIAYDFLAKGGKYSRPFITMATYDALTGGEATGENGEQVVRGYPDSIRRVAMSIEVFHKASLVHDDIEDDDEYRYGEQSIHRRYGIPTAINVGDYMVGFGYRLVSREAAELGPDVAADILDSLADAHQRLSEGQGAELLWRDSKDKNLKPIDALKIYALKTSPAFEAAFNSGIRLAGDLEKYRNPIRTFSRNLGVAFQILNDLGDWDGDSHNKMVAGGDLLGGRPTILWALALENLNEGDKQELISLLNSDRPAELRIQRARQLYHQAGVFEKANRLIDKHQAKAEEIADSVESDEFRRLLYYLIDTVLERSDDHQPTIEIAAPQPLTKALPILPKS